MEDRTVDMCMTLAPRLTSVGGRGLTEAVLGRKSGIILCTKIFASGAYDRVNWHQGELQLREKKHVYI